MITAELGAGERLIWSGQPGQGIRLRPSDALMIPFSLLWCGFAVFWEYSVVASGAPSFFVLWGIPFVGIGLYIVFGRFAVEARQRSRTYYGVTNERVIIVSGRRSVKSLNLRTLADVSLSDSASGTGTISFGSSPYPPWWFGAWWPGMNRGAPCFEAIQDARQVFQKLRDAQRQAA